VRAKNRVVEGKANSVVRVVACSSCGTNFPAQVTHKTPSEETANVKNAAERIRGVRDKFMATLKALREKIQALETERAALLVEVEKLRKAAELRATALEGEVSQMREEVKSLKELLGTSAGEKQVAAPVQKPVAT
jgi:uncharacterized coiled-coil DUF342 family protein